MKRQTLDRHTQIANNILFYVYTHIETDIDLEDLSRDQQISLFHMHRIFKAQFGRNLYETIQSIRLQKAANLLLTNRYSTISQIAGLCGYSAQSSFIRAFKGRFVMTPKAWRNGGYLEYSQEILRQSESASRSEASFTHLKPTILKMPKMYAYYIRHRGYGNAVAQVWQKLQTWVYTNHIEHFRSIALFHDNPAITPLHECQYVACIVTEEAMSERLGHLPRLMISDGAYARFDLEGGQGDLLKFIHWVYHEWLITSDYETTTKPAYVIYRRNPYLSNDASFELSFYLSVRY